MKKYQVAVEWSNGRRYFTGKSGYDDIGLAKFCAEQEIKRVQKVFEKNKRRGAKPTVYVLKVLG